MNQDDLLVKLKKDVRSLLTSSKLGLDPEQLRRDYVSMLGHPMPLRPLGFRNVMDMVQEMPDVVSVNYSQDGSICLKAVCDENTQNIVELVSRQRISKSEKARKFSSARYHHQTLAAALPRRGRPPPGIPANLRAQLRFLLSQGPLRLSELEVSYLRFYGYPLRVHNYGFYSTGEMLEAAKDMIVIQQGRLGSVLMLREEMRPRPVTPRRTGPIKPSNAPRGPSFQNSAVKVPQGPLKPPESTLYLGHNVSPVSHKLEVGAKSHDPKQIPEIYPAVQAHLQSPVPLDAMQNQRLKPPTRRRARELIEVKVEQVESPGSFYIRCSETEEAHALESLMFDMRRCYACPEVSEQYKLLDPFIRQGQVCCVSPSGIWFYRVVIDRVISSTHVEVFLLSFILSLSTVSIFSRSSFSVLPAQAIPSALTGIKPTSVKATDSFRKLCSDRVFVGALDCYTGDVLQLYLCDTRTDQDIYIHTVLIDQGHGVACRPATATAVSLTRNIKFSSFQVTC
uniref:Tudor domain-containing protein 5 n=1 Tax=Fundulus heteroclitus TaxID=8078 RepID=A0A3Q2TZS1_FUNHE